jgi:electron transfer flavoprotein beta subunit
MKFVAFVKTATGAAIDAADALARAGRIGPGTLGPVDARAVETAIRLREVLGGEVVAAAIAPADVMGAVREAIAIGADRGYLLADARIDAADLVGRGRIAAALLAHLGADVGIYGPWPGDVDGTILWSATGATLGWPVLPQARSLQIENGELVVSRQIPGGDLWLAAPPPCLIEITEGLPAARRSSLKSRQAARSKPLQLLTLDDIGCPPPVASRIAFAGRRPAPGRAQPVVLADPETACSDAIAFLREKGLV